MAFNIWEAIIIGLLAIRLSLHALHDGESKSGEKYSFGGMLIMTAVWIFVMYKAGLFQ